MGVFVGVSMEVDAFMSFSVDVGVRSCAGAPVGFSVGASLGSNVGTLMGAGPSHASLADRSLYF